MSGTEAAAVARSIEAGGTVAMLKSAAPSSVLTLWAKQEAADHEAKPEADSGPSEAARARKRAEQWSANQARPWCQHPLATLCKQGCQEQEDRARLQRRGQRGRLEDPEAGRVAPEASRKSVEKGVSKAAELTQGAQAAEVQQQERWRKPNRSAGVGREAPGDLGRRRDSTVRSIPEAVRAWLLDNLNSFKE